MLDKSDALLSTTSTMVSPSEQVEIAFADATIVRNIVGDPLGGLARVFDFPFVAYNF